MGKSALAYIRKLNAVTLNKDAFPIPRTRDCLDAVLGTKYFSTFDLTAGYHQVPVKEEDIPKTAFVIGYTHSQGCHLD
jgi:hypothetical protein